ncbi:MAG: hypothetical protein VXZ83_05300 [Verrucomicrobiota bacterium]|nr:hypothetical protein [Verrucomicrobiota bacterium]
MQSDDEIQTTLSKWPFIIGDILLVATALSIGILSDWQLTNWQVATCVVSVALGAAIFILPYIVEFQVRVREEREDRSADLRILQKRFISTQDQLELVGDRMETLEANLVHLSQDKSEDEAIGSLRSDLAALHLKVASLPAAPVKDPTLQGSPKAETQPKVKKPKGARKIPKSEPEAVKPADEAVVAKEVPAAEEDSPIPEPVEEEPTEVVETAKEDPVDAFPEEKMDEPKTKPTAKKKTAKKVAKKATKKAAKKDEPELVPEEDSGKREVESVEKDIPEEVVVEDLIVVPLEEEEADAEPITSEPETIVEPVIENKEQEEVPSEKEVDDSPEIESEAEDMFEEAVPQQAEKRVPTKKSDTAVIATVFIGIGNKPFLRGSGAGLNWESGVAMEFEEIGKWRWIAPSEQEGPIELQIYRNDEDPDSTGKYTLEPGQQLDISPVF